MKIRMFHSFDNYKNHTFITPWTFIHFLFGVFVYLFNLKFFKNISTQKSFVIVLIVHTLYEINDHIYLVNIWTKSSNSILNSIGDTVFSILGFYFAYKYLDVKIFNYFTPFYAIFLLFFIYIFKIEMK